MTDPTPKDLSNLIFEEFNALCPQGEHAPRPKPLSPAAQAVLDAYFTHADLLNREVSHEEMLAAALRALADQVVPDEGNFLTPAIAAGIRANILAIATKLEGTNGQA